MNKCIIIGRLTKDIDVRSSQSGTSVAKFTFAVDRRTKEKETDFINCTAFGKTAEVLQKYVKKGHRIGIVGHIQTGSYEKDGHKVYTTDVIVDEIEFLEKKDDGSGNAPVGAENEFADINQSTDLPF